MSDEMGGEVTTSAEAGSTTSPTETTATNTETSTTTASNNPFSGMPKSVADLKNMKPGGATTGATTTTATAKTAGVDGAAPTLPGATPPVVPPAYTPNFKFKFLDADGKTRKELEIEDWAKAAIKDADSEKKVRELFEKAYGLDYTKSSRDKFRTEAETLRGENTETKRALNVLSNYVQNDDLQSFFESLKIPEDKVLKYALNRLQYRELPPEKRQEYDTMRNTAQKAALLEEQNTSLIQEFQQTQVQTRESQLSQTLQDQNVLNIAQAFDARVGRPGAFRDQVVKTGQYYWAVHKKDIPVEQAVNEVMQMVGVPAMTTQPAVNNTTVTATQQNQAVMPDASPEASQAPEKKPVIPNIQGKGTSPAKKLPRSIKDLKRLRAEAG